MAGRRLLASLRLLPLRIARIQLFKTREASGTLLATENTIALCVAKRS
uniref:Uncharacterized protein n=1 Tax=Tetraselmis sp. GSL018 TaxID=582737 RepID=A0A061SE36_9CHLO